MEMNSVSNRNQSQRIQISSKYTLIFKPFIILVNSVMLTYSVIWLLTGTADFFSILMSTLVFLISLVSLVTSILLVKASYNDKDVLVKGIFFSKIIELKKIKKVSRLFHSFLVILEDKSKIRFCFCIWPSDNSVLGPPPKEIAQFIDKILETSD